jgi:hypothetical protein
MPCTNFTLATALNQGAVKGRHDANGSVIRWCFADPTVVATFASEFDALLRFDAAK